MSMFFVVCGDGGDNRVVYCDFNVREVNKVLENCKRNQVKEENRLDKCKKGV